jgi:CDP-2,3-bis-(O-geranylgeranyl)-sn-glycerol synthase
VARVDPVACALFLIAAFVIAGVAQTAWFKAPMSQRFAIPLDGGLTFRGRRVFGPHKTIRGFVVMVPAAAIAFGILALAAGDPASAGLWPLRAGQYVLLGAWAGFGFMAGELPNSFVKRQLGVAPGGIGAAANVRVIQRAVDRLDSPAGMLVALSAVAPIPALTWTIALFIGPILHGLFSLLLFRLGVKARPA